MRVRPYAFQIAAGSCAVRTDVMVRVVVARPVKVAMMLAHVRPGHVHLFVQVRSVDRMVAVSFVDNVQAAPHATRIPGPARPYVRQAAQIKTVVVMGVAAPAASVPPV